MMKGWILQWKCSNEKTHSWFHPKLDLDNVPQGCTACFQMVQGQATSHKIELGGLINIMKHTFNRLDNMSKSWRHDACNFGHLYHVVGSMSNPKLVTSIYKFKRVVGLFHHHSPSNELNLTTPIYIFLFFGMQNNKVENRKMEGRLELMINSKKWASGCVGFRLLLAGPTTHVKLGVGAFKLFRGCQFDHHLFNDHAPIFFFFLTWKKLLKKKNDENEI